MYSFVVIDRDAGRRSALRVFLEPEHEVLGCDTLQQVAKVANEREFRAAFLAWLPGSAEALKGVPKPDWSPDYLVPILLLPNDLRAEDVEKEAEQAGEFSKRFFPKARVKFVARFTVRDLQRAISEILVHPMIEFPEIVGATSEMLRLLQLAARVAADDGHLMLVGEPGTGKETLARWIHARSGRGQASAPFEIYHLCPRLDPALAVSELCGHASGAFPWAANPRKGSLEAANSGTLYIPEVRDLTPSAQVQLTKLLENPLARLERIGDDEPFRVDVRVIAGTTPPVQDSNTRELSRDLLNRFRVRLQIPPLRSRTADIPALMAHFLQQARAKRTFNDEAREALERYSWPDNLDELDAALSEAALQTDEGGEIFFEHLPLHIQHAIRRLGTA